MVRTIFMQRRKTLLERAASVRRVARARSRLGAGRGGHRSAPAARDADSTALDGWLSFCRQKPKVKSLKPLPPTCAIVCTSLSCPSQRAAGGHASSAAPAAACPLDATNVLHAGATAFGYRLTTRLGADPARRARRVRHEHDGGRLRRDGDPRRRRRHVPRAGSARRRSDHPRPATAARSATRSRRSC